MKRGLLFAAVGVSVACALPSVEEYAGAKRPDLPPSDGGDAAVGPGPTGEAGAPDATSTADAGPKRSCAEILAADPTAQSGYFATIHGELYCDMTTAGGGWTLIARTDGQGTSNDDFGWKQERGSARDESEPYCFPVLKRDLPFTQVLVGARTDEGKGWAQAYLLELGRDALLAAPNANVPVASITTAVGDCTPPGGPAMFRNAGYTDLENVFHFRDLTVADPAEPYGLFDDGMYVNNDACAIGGEIHEDDAMLMVR